MWWEQVTGSSVAQGDLLSNCVVPIIPDDFPRDGRELPIKAATTDVIILTQTCDIANGKRTGILVANARPIADLIGNDPQFWTTATFREIKKERRVAYCMLGPTDAENPKSIIIVDFGDLYTLPIGFVKDHALGLGRRFRLKSPYVEHLSQAFARTFMRVALPIEIPEIPK